MAQDNQQTIITEWRLHHSGCQGCQDHAVRGGRASVVLLNQLDAVVLGSFHRTLEEHRPSQGTRRPR